MTEANNAQSAIHATPVLMWVGDGEPAPGLSYATRLTEALSRIGHPCIEWPFLSEPPPAEFGQVRHHLITGGSTSTSHPRMQPALERLHDLLQRAEKDGVSLLGICLGAQMIASAFAGKVQDGPSANGMESGLREMTGVKDIAFKRFYTCFHFHEIYDDFADLPDVRVEMSNAHSPIQSYAIGDKVRGHQYHPEFSPEDARALVQHNKELIENWGGSYTGSLQSIDDNAGHWTREQFETEIVRPFLQERAA
jgi:GMP synthase-like glutamine amidotransferase